VESVQTSFLSYYVNFNVLIIFKRDMSHMLRKIMYKLRYWYHIFYNFVLHYGKPKSDHKYPTWVKFMTVFLTHTYGFLISF